MNQSVTKASSRDASASKKGMNAEEVISILGRLTHTQSPDHCVVTFCHKVGCFMNWFKNSKIDREVNAEHNIKATAYLL